MMRLSLGDDELRAAYGGAHALVYPSRYEGFGMPVLEAMACGAPVITCRNSSLVEVAGDAAMFVGEEDIDDTRSAIERLGEDDLRADLIARGSRQAAKFSFATMATCVADALLETHRRLSRGELARSGAVWHDLRETLAAKQNLQLRLLSPRQKIRKKLIDAGRKIGLDPAESRIWAKFREIQRGLIQKS